MEDTTAAAAMLQNSVCISLNLTRWGNAGSVDAGKVACDADLEMLRVRKFLLAADSYQAIVKYDNGIYTYIRREFLPTTFRRGIYRVPLASWESVDADLQMMRLERGGLISAFIADYPDLVAEQAPKKLRSIYRAADYPTADQVEGAFAMDWQYMDVTVPPNLPPSIRQDQEAKLARTWQETAEWLQAMERRRAADLVQSAVTALGRPKPVFLTNITAAVARFLVAFDGRNVTNDAELQGVVQQLRGIMAGVTPGALGKDPTKRREVAGKLATAGKALAPLVKRQVFFDD
jgi:hypothetical protein